MKFLRRKNIADLQEEDPEHPHSLRRSLGPINLILLGVGCSIGAGIFVLTGKVAAENAGPAVILSFIIAGAAAIFAAFCYSEFASLVPISGSAYTYSYTTLGEIFAWIIGWDLILEYAIGSVAVAVGWSGYVVSFLNSIGVHIPPTLSAARGVMVTLADGSVAPALFNLPAVFIVALTTALLVIGIRASANFNNIIVFIKVAVIVLFIAGAMHAINPDNWSPFIPENAGPREAFGLSGVMSGAGLVFFSYIGFDAVSTAAQETRNPKRDLPIGIIGSLLVCTVLYVLVSIVATGVVPFRELGVPDPIAHAADAAGMGWMAMLIKLGAIAGLSSVILVLLMGQSRILWCMSRDGLMPGFFGKVHPTFKTPWISTLITGIFVAIFAAFFTISDAGNLCNIGTLLAFFIVCVAVLILRIREPHHYRTFKTPAIWFVAPVGAASSLCLMIFLPGVTWERLLIWLGIGLVIYFLYGIRRSNLAVKN